MTPWLHSKPVGWEAVLPDEIVNVFLGRFTRLVISNSRQSVTSSAWMRHVSAMADHSCCFIGYTKDLLFHDEKDYKKVKGNEKEMEKKVGSEE